MEKTYNEREAHKFSSLHKESILKSNVCSCFFCLESFSPEEIIRWCDNGNTAICPKCGIDSVLGNFDIIITPSLLEKMRKTWFW